MRNTKRYFLVISLLLIFVLAQAQGQRTAIHISAQGTWDKSKNPERAQFGGDNKLLSNYFGSLQRDLIRMGIESNGVGCIRFRVAETGDVDSVVILQKIGNAWDSIFYNIVSSTRGKWRAGKINGLKVNETITIWYNVYLGPPLKKLFQEYMDDARKLFNKREFDKALRNVDSALQYDALNVEALILKAEALDGLNRKNDACNFIKSALKYDRDELNTVVKKICE